MVNGIYSFFIISLETDYIIFENNIEEVDDIHLETIII